MKTILIPTDFSKNALHAIKYALELFKCERSDIYFLHAYADELYDKFHKKNDTEFDIEKENLAIETERKLQHLIQGTTDESPNPKHNFKKVISCESLVDAVNDFVNQVNIDLVIMGTKGQTNEQKELFGSKTIQVFKYVKCPVLAVPEKSEIEQPKKILFPTDYMLPYKRRELKLLNCLSLEFKSQITCLYISDFEDLSLRQIDNKRFLTESLSDSYLFFERTEVKNKAKAITEHINLQQINLLVMVNSRHSFLEDLLYRSTIDEIGLTTKIPFLVMQNLSR